MARLANILFHRLALRLKMQSTCTCTEQTCRRHFRRLCGSSATVQNPSLEYSSIDEALKMQHQRSADPVPKVARQAPPAMYHNYLVHVPWLAAPGQLAAPTSRISAAACEIYCGVCGVV